MVAFTDAQKQRLQMLETEGRLTPDAVVADAKKKNSPLHDLFEWDMKIAAQAHWVERAREIIRRVTVVVRDDDETIVIPRYVRDPDRDANEQGYITIQELTKSRASTHEAIQREFQRAGSSLRRARDLARGLGFADDVEALMNQVAGLHERVAGEPELNV